LLVCLAGGLVVVPWLIRNHAVSGYWTLATVVDFNLLTYNAVSLIADQRGESEAAVRAELLREIDARLVEDGLGEDRWAVIEAARTMSREIVMQDPLRYLTLHLRRDLNSLLPAVTEILQSAGFTQGGKGTLAVLNQRGLPAAVDHYFGRRKWLLIPLAPWMMIWGSILLFAVLGTGLLLRRRAWFELLLLVGVAGSFLLVPGAASNPRFSVPATPFFTIVAGIAGSTLEAVRSGRGSRAERG
jgi:hypothetical protein